MTDVRRRITLDTAIAGVNIVPVIDLCLVLLVILLIISPILDRPDVAVRLPEAQTAVDSEQNLALSVDREGNIAVNQTRVPAARLREYLENLRPAYDPKVEVVVRADEEVDYGTLTGLIKTAKEAGYVSVSVGTRKPERETP